MLAKIEMPLSELLHNPFNTNIKEAIEKIVEKNFPHLISIINSNLTQNLIINRAIEDGKLDVVMFLIDNGYIEKFRFGILEAGFFGQVNIVKNLHIFHKNMLNFDTTLCYAASQGHFALVQYLLENSDANPATSFYFPIKEAITNKHFDIALLLSLHPALKAQIKLNKEEFCQDLEKIKKTFTLAFSSYINKTYLFFKSSSDNNCTIKDMPHDVKYYIAQIGLNVLRKQLNCSDQCIKNIFSFWHKIQANMDEQLSSKENRIIPKGIFTNSFSANNDFMNKVIKYINLHPKKKPFLESIKNKNYEQALRRSCAVGDEYLIDILIHFIEKEDIKLNLDNSGPDGKTPHHIAAIYANKSGNLYCLKKLLNYSFLHSVSYNFSKDVENNTFEDYLNETNKEEIDCYILSKFKSFTNMEL
ncbi:MAG: ankyrin repeat domain-containing protein [Nitrosopumilus sp.]|nr:ankyrin repeat domain-containing protein [Nitrosopumilus sp.]